MFGTLGRFVRLSSVVRLVRFVRLSSVACNAWVLFAWRGWSGADYRVGYVYRVESDQFSKVFSVKPLRFCFSLFFISERSELLIDAAAHNSPMICRLYLILWNLGACPRSNRQMDKETICLT